MYAAVVKFDTLSDSVWTAAEDHNLRFVCGYRVFVRCVVGGVIVSAVLCAAYVDTFPGFLHTERDTVIADIFFRNLQNLAQVFIGETVFFRCDEHFVRRHASFVFEKRLFLLNQFFHLFNKVSFYFGKLEDFFYRSALSQCFVHDKVTLAGRCDQHLEKLFFCFGVKIFGMAKTVTSCFQTADSFLERFFVSFSDAHHFAYGAHLCAELVFYAFEFFKCPACKFDYDIVSVWHVFIQRTVFSAWNIL